MFCVKIGELLQFILDVARSIIGAEQRRGAPPGFLLKSCSAPLCDDVITALILQRYKHLHNRCRALHSSAARRHLF